MNALIEKVSTLLSNAALAAPLLDALLKSFLVLGLAGGVCALWRRAAAATRHLIWFLAVASLPCLPLLPSPVWQQPVWTISTAAESGNQISLAIELAPKSAASATSRSQPASPVSPGGQASGGGHKIAAQFDVHWILLGWLAWLIGVLCILARIALGQWGRREFSRQTRRLTGPDWLQLMSEAGELLRLRRPVTLLQAADGVMPMTWGWWRPVVLLPAEAAAWPAARRRVVLLHELAHIKRWDYLTQLVAQLVCAIYWFNPLVWLAARQMRLEREAACDDLVLAGGCKSSDYASHLVEIAGSFRRVPEAAAIAMARSSHLEGRIAAIVDASRNRRLRWSAALAILALIGGLAVGFGGSATQGGSGANTRSGRPALAQLTQLEVFSKQKEKQSAALAAAAGETVSPRFHQFFAAATSGDWQRVTNLYESFKQHHPQYSHVQEYPDLSLRTSFWSPVLEICLAYDHVVRCEPAYTQMAVDDLIHSIPAGSIYFGGTDPGRGLPTAFCKSHVDADPFYTLTQNALADGTYLQYLRSTYGDHRALLGQFAEGCRTDSELTALNASLDAAEQKLAAIEMDDTDSRWKAAYEAVQQAWERRNDRAKEIVARVQTEQPAPAAPKNRALYIPTLEDSQRCFQDYVADARIRAENHQLKPNENFEEKASGRIQVSGQGAVMQINGLLAKLIFDRNPGHEFFVEESFPLDWMYPYLEPHGLIMKLNREPLAELSDDQVRRDREFWQPRVTQMVGGWLKDETPVDAVIAFAEKIYLRHELSGFAGDPRYVQNDYACRMFSKFRSSLAGLYAWRADQATAAGDKERMARAADLAFRQSLALCPYSPEAVYRYASFLAQQQRQEDSKRVLAMIERFKPESSRTASEAKAPVFQVRLALETPTDNTEPMRLVAAKDGAQHTETLYVTKEVLLDQTAIQSASVGESGQGNPTIDISLTDTGRKQFADITRHYMNHRGGIVIGSKPWAAPVRLGIIIDGNLWMAPVIQTEITEGKVQITGSFSQAEASALVAKINEARE